MSNVLITGGSGLIGMHLSTILLGKGYTIGHLTRSTTKELDSIKLFSWDIDNNEIDENAIPWADHIIHLAGETVGQRWTKNTKKKILQSRVNSTMLIIEQLKRCDHQLKSLICASAIGYYGADTGDKMLIEESPPGEDFLADVVAKWEAVVDTGTNYTERLVKIRTGIVLTENGGALAKMAMPIKLGVGSALGSGEQWMSWIHIEDLCNMYVKAVEEPLHGIFNGVGPNPVSNKTFTKTLAHQLKRPILLPRVPAFVLKLMLGEMSVLALGSNRVAPVAFLKEGFTFGFPELEAALESLV